MATASKRGLVDKVKKVAARAGTRGARVLVDTAVAATRTVDTLQSKLERVRDLAPGLKKSKKNEAARVAPVSPLTSAPAATSRRASTTARGAIESAKKPTPKATTSRTPRAVENVAATAGRKTVPTQAAAAKRSTAKRAATPGAGGFKVKRGQKHRHHR